MQKGRHSENENGRKRQNFRTIKGCNRNRTKEKLLSGRENIPGKTNIVQGSIRSH